MRICIKSTELELLSWPAIWAPQEHTLIVADTHFGKSAAFRERGLAVPEGDLNDDLQRISALKEKFLPKRFIVAGDFLHSPHGLDQGVEASLRNWAEKNELTTEIATGNHDRQAGKIRSSKISYSTSLKVGELTIIHDPVDFKPDDLGICGHIHPVVSVKSGKRARLRLPAFWLKNDKQLIMPSFGSLTGGQVISPNDNDRIFAVLGNEVREIPNQLCQKRTRGF